MAKRRGYPTQRCTHEWTPNNAKGYRYCLHCDRRYRDTWMGTCITCGKNVWRARATTMPDPAHCQHIECAIAEANARTERARHPRSALAAQIVAEGHDSPTLKALIERQLCD